MLQGDKKFAVASWVGGGADIFLFIDFDYLALGIDINYDNEKNIP